MGSSATLGTSTAFAGNILADQRITLDTTATIRCGRAIALNAAVTMDTNTISDSCNGGLGGGIALPEPSALALVGIALAGLAWSRPLPA